VPAVDLHSAQVSTSNRAINGLWFISLTLALIVSMFAILAKQWIVMFSTRMRAPVSHMRRWAQRHRAFRDGIDQWKLNAFISSLSVAIHVAVFIFLVGLVVRLYELDIILFAIVLSLTTLTLTFYIASTIAPLFHGTCPTLTPLLMDAHGTISGLLAVLGISARTLHGLFDERAARGDISTEDGWHDASVVTWMVEHLPAGSDLDVVLDALGSADLRCSLNQFGDVVEYIRSTTRNRLERLADNLGGGEVDGGELARVLRSCIFLEEDSLAWPTGLSSTNKLVTIRTHDVPALCAALELQLSRSVHLQSGNQAAADPEASHRPDSPDLDVFLSAADDGTRQRRLHGHLLPHTRRSSAQITFALETWQFGRQIRDDDPELRRILEVVSALARWNSSTSPRAPPPIAAQTRGIILEKIIRAVTKVSSPLQIAQCTALVLAFGHDISTAERCHIYTTPIIHQFFKWNFDPEILDWRLQALQVWARMFSQYDRLRRDLHGRPTRAEVWKVYSHLLRVWRLEEHWPTLSANRVYQMLQPFESAVRFDSSDWPAQTGHGAINILVSCFPAGDHEDNDPSPMFSRLATLVLYHTLDLSAPDIGLREQLVVLLRRMLAGGGDHSIHVILPRGQPLTSDNFAAALSTRLRNILSPLVHKVDDVILSKSVWSLASEYLQASGRADTLIGFASQLTVELAILNGLNIDPSQMFDELLGRGRGAAFIIAPEAKGRAFIIARHARPFARTWWKDLTQFLKHADWYAETGFPTAATFIAACEHAAPCTGCRLVISRVLEEIQQSQFRSQSTGVPSQPFGTNSVPFRAAIRASNHAVFPHTTRVYPVPDTEM